jgi:hypothetical protein
MSSQATETAQRNGAADLLVSLTVAEGSADHRYVMSHALLAGRDSIRNQADAVHYLGVLHGLHPGVIDHAAAKPGCDAAQDWLGTAIEAFAAERAYLTRLTVAVGPVPSTPGQADSEAAVLQQRHALDTLAQSDRKGCALGAAFALALDWRAIRLVLDTAATKLGVDVAPCLLPDEAQTHAAALMLADSNAVERAIGFGAQQILAQHRGLWDLLEARQMARAGL